MAIDSEQLKQLVIIPSLRQANMFSESAVTLLLGTCAQESKMGTYLAQIHGPALGIYQIEPKTHQDVWTNFIKFNPSLSAKLNSMFRPSDNELLVNLSYSTIICRIIYLRAPGALPDSDDIEGLAAYWKEHYNTRLGRGNVEDFVSNYRKFIK